MSTDNTGPNWTTWILAGFATAVALAGGLGVSNLANHAAKSPIAVATTNCSGFEADAHKLLDLDKAGAAALSGTFAPGDHVHLAIDLNGVDHSWKLTGALGKKPKVTGAGWSESANKRVISTTSITPGLFTTAPVSSGHIVGYAKLQMEIDVTAAGDGAITFSKTGSESSSTPLKIASASCKGSRKKSLQPMV